MCNDAIGKTLPYLLGLITLLKISLESYFYNNLKSNFKF